jgi:MFS family permease
LALLAVADFVVILDGTIVNVALPSIGTHLHASTSALSWVISAYVLAFSGLLLLGGRLADLFGRRRLFIAGLIVFGLASLAGGLSRSIGELIVLRAVQGAGAAALAPAARSIITTLFEEGAERGKAMGIWAAVAGSGSVVGLILGGVLTSTLGWSWGPVRQRSRRPFRRRARPAPDLRVARGEHRTLNRRHRRGPRLRWTPRRAVRPRQRQRRRVGLDADRRTARLRRRTAGRVCLG